MLGDSPAFRTMLAQIRKLAALAEPIFIHGETGTGKELVAHALHEHSRMSAGPFVALNCGALPTELAESELFGHVRGSITGALRDYRGAFERASTGTLFLDEVAELPLVLQAKLLRAVETGRVRPVGAELEREASARLLLATHCDLAQMVEEGRFRADLFHRLCVLRLSVPPLRARATDLTLLAESFRAAVCARLGRTVRFSPCAFSAAQRYPWPGNIRELRNAVTRAVVLCEGHTITATELLPGEEEAPVTSHALERANTITVQRGTFRQMRREMLRTIVAEQGSLRKAARQLNVPRSTLAGWLQEPALPSK